MPTSSNIIDAAGSDDAREGAGRVHRITTEWVAAGRSHAGWLLIVGIDHAEFGLILRVIDHALSICPDQAASVDYAACGTGSART